MERVSLKPGLLQNPLPYPGKKSPLDLQDHSLDPLLLLLSEMCGNKIGFIESIGAFIQLLSIYVFQPSIMCLMSEG